MPPRKRREREYPKAGRETQSLFAGNLRITWIRNPLAARNRIGYSVRL